MISSKTCAQAYIVSPSVAPRGWVRGRAGLFERFEVETMRIRYWENSWGFETVGLGLLHELADGRAEVALSVACSLSEEISGCRKNRNTNSEQYTTRGVFEVGSGVGTSMLNDADYLTRCTSSESSCAGK